MAETKLTHAKIPTRNAKKPEKLGLLTPKKRKDITFRFRRETLELLEDLLKTYRISGNHKISRTDILETMAFYATQISVEEFNEKYMEYSKKYIK